MVGTRGFEPLTTTPPVWCATRLRYAPILKHLYANKRGRHDTLRSFNLKQNYPGKKIFLRSLEAASDEAD